MSTVIKFLFKKMSYSKCKGVCCDYRCHLHLPSFCVTASEEKASPKYFRAPPPPFLGGQDQSARTIMALTQRHPGSLLARPAALPGWLPGPGKCHCGRAAACSRRAARERAWSAQWLLGGRSCMEQSLHAAPCGFLIKHILTFL